MGGTVSASRWESCIFPLCLSVYPCWTLEDPCGKGVLLTSKPWDERNWDLSLLPHMGRRNSSHPCFAPSFPATCDGCGGNLGRS